MRRHGTTANTTRQIDKQRVISIDDTTLLGKLRFKTLACDGIPKEQRAGILVINKETVRVRLRCVTSFLDCNTIILLIFHDRNAMAAQFRFFPCPGISRHMYCHLKANAGAHNAD